MCENVLNNKIFTLTALVNERERQRERDMLVNYLVGALSPTRERERERESERERERERERD